MKIEYGWILANIVVPLMAPIFGVLLIRSVPQVANVKILSQVKDGQVGWLAIAMCAAAIYELGNARQECELAATKDIIVRVPTWFDPVYNGLNSGLAALSFRGIANERSV